MKKLYILFLFIVLSLNGYTQSDTTATNTAANTSFLDFVKKVYFNPTILLKTQNFKAANNVQIQLLPSNSSQSPQSIKGFELAMQKVIRFILESGSEGIVRYYFNPNFPSTPFSVVCSEELHCKFTSVDIDSITNRLNAPFKNTAINYNNSALFEGAIQAGMDYTAQCLRNNPGKCGKKPENLISEINTKPLYITLNNTNGSKYDTDTFRYENYSSYYTQVYDLFTQQNVHVPAKLFIAGGSTEPLSLAIHKREANILKQNFRIVYMATEQALELEPGSSADSLKIKLPQHLPANQIAEFGVYYKSTQDSITYLVGSFMVHAYTEKTINLHLVSIDGAAIPQQDIAAALKKIYDPVGVKFNISTTKNITANPSWTKDITIESSGLLSSYTKELKDYVSAVKDLNNYDKDDYYIVFGLSCNNGITGYMPRKSNIGFVFTNTADAGDVLAHEIGHGAFHLRHIFSDEELGASMQGMTKNLMDYVDNPMDLHVSQWEGIDDPVAVGWFEGDDEEGMYRKPKCLDSINLVGGFCMQDMICLLKPYFIFERDSVMSGSLRSNDSIVFNIYSNNTYSERIAVYIWKYKGINLGWNYLHFIEDSSDRRLIYRGATTFYFNPNKISKCDDRTSSYCEDTVIIPIIPPKVYDYLVYVAYPEAWAAPGVNDNSIGVMLYKAFMGGNTSLQVGHTGICIVKSDTITKKAKIDYYDFGRFEGAPPGNGIRRYYDLGYLNIFIDPIDTTYKIAHVDSINILINNIDYFAKNQSTYNRKEIGIAPLSRANFLNALSKATSEFYNNCTFGFGENKSFCTDFVHDIFIAGGIPMVDISERLNDFGYKMQLKDWLKTHDKDTKLMKYWDSGDSFLKNVEVSPLPINFAIDIKKRYPKFNLK